MSDDKPNITIECDWFNVEVTDKRTAEAAFPLVQQVFTQWLGKAPQAGEMQTKPPKTQVFTECPECEYAWVFNGHYPERATCPQCSNGLNALANEVEQGEDDD